MSNNEQKWIPIHDYKLGKANTVSGRIIDYHEPANTEINIMDIAISLSNICRFGGHVNKTYSVAQHSVLVMALCPPKIAREALMHDAAEVYVGDAIKPWKEILGQVFKVKEEAFSRAICNCFNLDYDIMNGPAVKEADNIALKIEHEALRNNNLGPLMTELRRRKGLNISIGMAQEHFSISQEGALKSFLFCFEKEFNLANPLQFIPKS